MRVFSSIPFSRSIVLTASMMSRLIPLPLVDQVAPHDRVVRDVRRLAVRDADRQTSVVCGENSALEALPPSELDREHLDAGHTLLDALRDLSRQLPLPLVNLCQISLS